MKLRLIIKKMIKRKSTLISMIVLLIIILMALLAPTILINSPYDMDLTNKFAPMSFKYPMGTDDMGRCLFTRVIYGARATLGYAIASTVISAIFGTIVGMFSGYNGGKIDSLIMRVCDVMYAFPNLVFTLVIVSILGPGMKNILIAMLIVQWIWYARMSRNLTLNEITQDYIASARVNGSSSKKIIFKHILPNIFGQMLALTTIDFGHTILTIAGFSFLGLGVQPPQAEWGVMINDGRSFIHNHPMIMFYPGIMILLTSVSTNIIGDHLRDILEEGRN